MTKQMTIIVIGALSVKPIYHNSLDWSIANSRVSGFYYYVLKKFQ